MGHQEDVSFTDRFNKEVLLLAKEVRAYADTSWHILAHRPRLFSVSHELVPAPSGEYCWLNLCVGSEGDPCFLRAEFSSATKNFGPPRLASLPYCYSDIFHGSSAFRSPFTVLGGRIIDDLIGGLAYLFTYIQSECRRCVDECFASWDAARRWEEYDKAFVERVNNTRLADFLVRTMQEIRDSGIALRTNAHSSGWLFDHLELPASAALRRVELVEEATKARKLYIG